MAWEDVAEEKLYKQLGMTSTSSRGELRYWCVIPKDFVTTHSRIFGSRARKTALGPDRVKTRTPGRRFMNFSRFLAFSAITGPAERKNSLQMRRFQTISEFSHGLGQERPILSQARSRSKGPLSDQVADATKPRGQCRSWVDCGGLGEARVNVGYWHQA
jgi:hypothetical protein